MATMQPRFALSLDIDDLLSAWEESGSGSIFSAADGNAAECMSTNPADFELDFSCIHPSMDLPDYELLDRASPASCYPFSNPATNKQQQQQFSSMPNAFGCPQDAHKGVAPSSINHLSPFYPFATASSMHSTHSMDAAFGCSNNPLQVVPSPPRSTTIPLASTCTSYSNTFHNLVQQHPGAGNGNGSNKRQRTAASRGSCGSPSPTEQQQQQQPGVAHWPCFPAMCPPPPSAFGPASLQQQPLPTNSYSSGAGAHVVPDAASPDHHDNYHMVPTDMFGLEMCGGGGMMDVKPPSIAWNHKPGSPAPTSRMIPISQDSPAATAAPLTTARANHGGSKLRSAASSSSSCCLSAGAAPAAATNNDNNGGGMMVPQCAAARSSSSSFVEPNNNADTNSDALSCEVGGPVVTLPHHHHHSSAAAGAAPAQRAGALKRSKTTAAATTSAPSSPAASSSTMQQQPSGTVPAVPLPTMGLAGMPPAPCFWPPAAVSAAAAAQQQQGMMMMGAAPMLPHGAPTATATGATTTTAALRRQNTAAAHALTGEEPVRSRAAALERYREKKARRAYTKKIRYQLRKINADRRPRIKGRFVKKDEMHLFAHLLPGANAAAAAAGTTTGTAGAAAATAAGGVGAGHALHMGEEEAALCHVSDLDLDLEEFDMDDGNWGAAAGLAL